jgi:hypothetical protein
MKANQAYLRSLLENGKLPSLTNMGMYPIVYVTKYDEYLCAPCATIAMEDVAQIGVYEEGPITNCADCNCVIESAHGPCGEPASP